VEVCAFRWFFLLTSHIIGFSRPSHIGRSIDSSIKYLPRYLETW
jgi:hypothetical protein